LSERVRPSKRGVSKKSKVDKETWLLMSMSCRTPATNLW